MLQRLLSGCALFAIGTGLAHATLIEGTTLQNALDSRTYDGSFQNVNTQQAPADQLWTLASSNSGTALMMFEIASFADQNAMGIYDPRNPSNSLQLFAGADSAGAQVGLIQSSTTPGLIGTCIYSGFGCTFTGHTIQLAANGHFGLYLDSPANGGTRFYSDASLNTDAAADGTTDHMVAYAGDGTNSLDPLGTGHYGLFAPGEYVLAWEDQLLSQSDRDYADMVVLTESITPVPEPGPLALLGAGLLGLGLLQVRKRRRRACFS